MKSEIIILGNKYLLDGKVPVVALKFANRVQSKIVVEEPSVRVHIVERERIKSIPAE